MARPVTLFTGQWADLPLEVLCKKARQFGYDGLELACWGDHFEEHNDVEDKNYIQRKWELLQKHGLKCFAISSHLVGQGVCDLIDARHKAILPENVWGDGKPEGVRAAAEEMKLTAKAARQFFEGAPRGLKSEFKERGHRVVVNGFSGSSIWHLLYSFPLCSQASWKKVLKILAGVGIRFLMFLMSMMSCLPWKCIRRKSPLILFPRARPLMR